MRMSDDDFSNVVDTNLGGAFRTVKRAIKSMIKARRGRIILISSVSGLFGVAGQANYSASKSGLVGFARAITRELGGRGITANVVAPGFIESDMTAELDEQDAGRVQQADPGRSLRNRRGDCGGRVVARGRRGELHLGRRHPGRRRPRHGTLTPERRQSATGQQRDQLRKIHRPDRHGRGRCAPRAWH